MSRIKLTRMAALLVTFLVVLGLFSTSEAAGRAVSASVETVTIPTFLMGPPDPQPAIFERSDWYSAYPRSMFRVQTRAAEPIDEDYQMVVLENDLLRVEVLPEVGGRVWRIIDKASGRNLLWTNDAVKPIRVGRRRGWLAGGIELAFPVGNHGQDTMEPYRWKIVEKDDGSASVFVSAFDHFYRFWSTYEISLSPGSARMGLTVRLYNPTPVRNRYQFWVNAAVHTGDDMQFIMPVDHVAGHGFGGVHEWPEMSRDSDQSLYRNVPNQLGVFGWDAPFIAAYFHEEDYGLVRYAHPSDTRGIKIWTWGTRSYWAREYSIAQGSYNEIQGGKWPVQDMSGWLEPHQMDQWTEYWYPVRGLGGVDAASEVAALTLALDDDFNEAHLRLNTLTAAEGTLTVRSDMSTLVSRHIDAVPGDLISETIDIRGLSEDASLTVTLVDRHGSSLIDFEKSLQPAQGPTPELPPTVELGGSGIEWDELSAAMDLEVNEGDFVSAASAYRSIVSMWPDFQPAWKALGILRYRQLDDNAAVEALRRATTLDPTDMEARYYLALAEMKIDHEAGIDTLRSISGEARWTRLAAFLLAREDLREGRYGSALEGFEKAGRGHSHSCILWDSMAVAARLDGRHEMAVEALAAALACDPMDPVASVERLFVNGEADQRAIRKALGTDANLYLEVALFYDGLNRTDEALLVARSGEGLAESGLYYYYLSYLAGRADEHPQTLSYAETAADMGTDYVFPHRREAVTALRYVAELTGEGAYPRYFEGVMLYWLGRQDEALELWQGLVGRFDVPGLYRIVATAFTRGRLTGDFRTAEGLYLKAIEQDPEDAEAYAQLADIYYAMNDRRSRRDLLQRARRLFPEDDNIALMTAVMLTERRQFREAASILETHQFRRAHQSRELWQLAYNAITGTYTGLAIEAMRSGDRQRAVEHLERAARYEETISMWFD